MTNQRVTPPYSEAQATAWLSWLAYNMQRRDQSILQIENLQPSWLTPRGETGLHLLLTRLLWGLIGGGIAGLLFGLVGGLTSGTFDRVSAELSGEAGPGAAFGVTGMLGEGLLFGLLLGLLLGVLFGLFELVLPLRRLDGWLRGQGGSTRVMLTGIVVYGILGGLLVGVPIGLLGRLSDVAIIGLLFALPFAYIRTSRATLRDYDHRIHCLESLQWSWRNVRRSALRGGVYGVLGGAVFGLLAGLFAGFDYGLSGVLGGGPMTWLTGGLFTGLSFALIFGPLMGLLFGLLGGLIGGFQPAAREMKTRPNQGMRLTVQSAVKMSVVGGLVVGLLTMGVTLPTGAEDGIVAGVMAGGVAALILGLWYGGLDIIEHGLVRISIAQRGHGPLNYARFLDYATDELNFLQRVGGGYTFIHRYLLEHFAEIAVEKEYVAPTEEEKPAYA